MDGDDTTILRALPKHIWLLPDANGETTWCDDPDPGNSGYSGVAYVKADALDAKDAEIAALRERVAQEHARIDLIAAQVALGLGGDQPANTSLYEIRSILLSAPFRAALASERRG